MVEKIGHVRNPLTVIAIFAALAEVSGTVVLPFLSQVTQELYIWFLMGFPLFLVAVFFLVLYKKHHVLYAPSDFHDDKMFKDLLENASGTVKVKKLKDETETAAEQTSPEETTADPQICGQGYSEVKETYVRSFRGTGLLAEELVVAKLSKDFGVTFERNVALKSNPKLVFDAISTEENKPIVLEVRFTRAGILEMEQIEEYFQRAGKFSEGLPESLRNKIIFFLAIVTDRDDRADRIEKTVSRIREKADMFPFKTTVVTYKLKDLEHELEGAVR